MGKQLTRSEVPVEMTWNLDDIFPSVEAWEAELKAVSELVPTVTKYKGRLHEGPKVMLECFVAQENLQKRLAKVRRTSSSTRQTASPPIKLGGTGISLGTQIRAETPSSSQRL